MRKQTVYTKYRFSGINNLVYTDDNKWYLADSFTEKKVRFKNGRNGLYINKKFVSLRKLRKLAYKHRELLFKKIDSSCPF